MHASAQRHPSPGQTHRTTGRAAAPPGSGAVSFDTSRRTAPLQRLQAAADARGTAPVQRAIEIKNIDYDPVNKFFHDGGVRTPDAFNTLEQLVKDDKGFAGYINQLAHVMGKIRDTDYEAPDIPSAAGLVAADMVRAWGDKGMVVGHKLRDLKELVLHAFAQHPQGGQAMDRDETTAFDDLKTRVGADKMSRSKGNPTSIAKTALPGALASAVTSVEGEIDTATTRWATAANLSALNLFPGSPSFNREVHKVLKNSRTAHTNNAGWLPALASPVDHVQATKTAIYNAASAHQKKFFDAGLPMTKLTKNGALTSLGVWFKGQVTAKRQLLSTAMIRESLFGTIDPSGPYLEFNLTGGISRAVYDWQNGDLYLSAHFKWGAGYNPFFKVT